MNENINYQKILEIIYLLFILMIQNAKTPTDQQIRQILNAREQDILIRGKQHSVYDYDGTVLSLGSASLWYDNSFNYVKPTSSQMLDCVIS